MFSLSLSLAQPNGFKKLCNWGKQKKKKKKKSAPLTKCTSTTNKREERTGVGGWGGCLYLSPIYI